MAYSRRKIRTKKSRKSRRNKRSRSYKKGGIGQYNTPPRGANGARYSAAPGQYGQQQQQQQQQYGQQQQNYSPVQGNNNLMGAFNAAATPGPLTGRYNQSGQYSPSSVAYPGWN